MSFICFQFLSAQTSKNSKTVDSSHLKITHNGIWSWFSDPRAVYFEGEHKKIYLGWIDNYGDIYVGSYDITNHTIETKVIYNSLEIDDHNNPSILVDTEGYIHVFFTSHTIAGQPIFYLKSAAKECINAWDKVTQLSFENNENTNHTDINYTYTNPVQLQSEQNKMYLFWRGKNEKPYFSSSTNLGKSWANAQLLFSPKETDVHLTPYTKIFTNNTSKIHFTFTNTHPKTKGVNTLYYTYYEDGYFFKANGKKIKSIKDLPLTEEDLDVVYKSENLKVWNWDLAEDDNGQPIVGFTVFEGKENHIYYYSTYSAKQWQHNRLLNAGNWFPEDQNLNTQSEPYYSGGMSFNHSNPKEVYLSIKKNGIFEIEAWMTKNNGKNWKKTVVTQNSKYHNVRPYGIKNIDSASDINVLWLQIENYVHYGLATNQIKTFSNRYKSSILGNFTPPKFSNVLNKANLIYFTNSLLSAMMHKTTLVNDPNSLEFNVLFEAAKRFNITSKNEIIKSELENQIELLGDEDDIDSLTDEALLWYRNIYDNRLITNRLSEINVAGLDIKNKVSDFIKLIRLIDVAADDIVVENAEKTIKTLFKEPKTINWFIDDSYKSDSENLLEAIKKLYAKLWLHKKDFYQFKTTQLKKEMEQLFLIVLNMQHKRQASLDTKTIAWFTILVSEFINHQNTF